jgi:hypothetical protein
MNKKDTQRSRQSRDRQRGQDSNPRRRANTGAQRRLTTATSDTTNGRGTQLRDSPTMVRLLDALERGEDIGHYGRLTFTMVARFFMDEEQLVQLLAKQPGQGKTDASALVMQVATHDYSPPTRERILTWQREQAYQIIPEPDDPNSGNLYKELRFPDEVYEQIGEYYGEQAEAAEAEEQQKD